MRSQARRAIGVVLACRLLTTVLLTTAFLTPALAAENPSETFDFEAAGGAAAAGPMYSGAVRRAAEFCGGIAPATAASWRDRVAEWDERNAPWMKASETVRGIALRKVEEAGEDADAVKRASDEMIAEFVDDFIELIRGAGDADEQRSICVEFAVAIAEGRLDVSGNAYAPAVKMLREHLPPVDAAEQETGSRSR